jgi:acetyltransferase-like isoleucine patch superfamily enzyme
MIHPTSEIKSEDIGENTAIWQYVVIMAGAKLGSFCNVGSHTFIENKVVIGDRVTIKNGVLIFDGVTIEDDCLIGPGVVFTNDIYPRSDRLQERSQSLQTISLGRGVSIGANSTIRAGISIKEYALIGAGTVVTKDIPSFSLVVGNPGEIVGKVDVDGNVVERFV